MHIKRILMSALCIFVFSAPVWAELVKYQGIGQVTYKGLKAGSNEREQAVKIAKRNAIEKYMASFSSAKMMNYEKIRSKVESDLDRYILEYIIVDDVTDKELKFYRVVVDVNINAALLEVELQKASAVQQASAEERSYLSFVFVAREVISKKSFDARKAQRTTTEELEDESESTALGDTSVEYSGSTKKDSVMTTGGSTTKKSDQFEYDVSNAEDINASMTAVFSGAGFEVIDAVYLQNETDELVNVDNFIEDFRYGDDITGETQRNAVKGCRSVGVEYFAIGSVDVGAQDIDPVSGMTRVHVSVIGKILFLGERFPKTIASVGPIQYAGLGPDQAVARKNALRQAGENAAKDLVAKLRAKEIK